VKKRRILVTSALPYANGPLHFGHLIEAIQTDIWVRFQKLKGHEAYYICASDAHGTPIMVKAREQGVSPEVLAQQVRLAHQRDYQDFEIAHDNFYTTDSAENKQLATEIYQRLKARGDISSKTIMQAYDLEEGMFLPDRYIKGTCPSCRAPDQYGDSCEVCGKSYDTSELINPVSILSGKTPTQKATEHFFFELGHFQTFLAEWVDAGHLQSEVANKLKEWFEAGLKAWDITRDAPYFGFEIPETVDKYFYVWLDAPVGYMASFQQYCYQNSAVNFEDFWHSETETELYHFIGKDIVYFHGLFWPAMLKGANYRTPTGIFVHGFLTVNGLKMSKSRGTFIKARTYLEHFEPTYLRYYFAAKLSGKVEDIDLNLEDFVQRSNSDLVGKLVNIASRSAGFIYKKFQGELSEVLSEPTLFSLFVDARDDISNFFETREYHRATRLIMELADKANQYVDEKKPWVLAKDPEKDLEVQAVCTMALNLFKILMTYLKPIVPTLAQKSEHFLNHGEFRWDNLAIPLLGGKIREFTPLLQRIDQEKVNLMLESSKESL
jgi:methionyl-tRNA synthetase